MTTLISSYNSDGCTGRCDARCHDAAQPECDCICGGMNHGKGSKQAATNTHAHATEMIKAWTEDHPDTDKIVFATKPTQLNLFP